MLLGIGSGYPINMFLDDLRLDVGGGVLEDVAG